MKQEGKKMLNIDLKDKKAFVAGIGDDQGFGWAIAKALCEAGAELIIGTWPPVVRIFKTAWESGKFNESRKLNDGTLMQYSKIYPLDAAFDKMEDVPKEIAENKRYADLSGYTISEVAKQIEQDFGRIDILVHSIANAPEVTKPLLETSRSGYLAALSNSSYSLISLLANFAPIMPKGSAALSLTYIAATQVIPGYGGGMSTAKAALESDIRTAAFELGHKGIRVNCISAGPWKSRAAKAIGLIDKMIAYSKINAPISNKELTADEVGVTAAFLLSPHASAITGTTVFVDNGLNIMGMAIDSKSTQEIV